MLSYLELVELANGDIVLQKSEGDDRPLVIIQFSEETRRQMPGSCLEVARAMVQAGLEAAAVIEEEEAMDLEDDEAADVEFSSKTLH